MIPTKFELSGCKESCIPSYKFDCALLVFTKQRLLYTQQNGSAIGKKTINNNVKKVRVKFDHPK